MQIKSGRILDILWAFLIKQLLAKKHSSSSKKTSRWTTSAIGRIFAELNNPLSLKLVDKHALSNMNLTSMEVSMFLLVLNQK